MWAIDSTIIAAIISGVFAITTPLIIYFVTKHKKISSPSRVSSILGRWQGYVFSQHEGSEFKGQIHLDIFIFKNTMRFKATTKGIVPDHEMFEDRNKERVFDLKGYGEVSFDRFITAKFNHIDKNIEHLGVLFLELNALGNRMKGRGISYGALSQRVVFDQKIYLKKIQ